MNTRWWNSLTDELIDVAKDNTPAYVYSLQTVEDQCKSLRRNLTAVDRYYYAMKANNHLQVLNTVINEGFGIECVSLGEVRFIRRNFPLSVPVLYTPNFCDPLDYAEAFILKANVVVDEPDLLKKYPSIFQNKQFGLRIDPGRGDGHHGHVITAGGKAKFGCLPDRVPDARQYAEQIGAKIVGIHAHIGSGIKNNDTWAQVFRYLSDIRRRTLKDAEWIDIGGGLPIKESNLKTNFDIGKTNIALQHERGEAWSGNSEVWIEPGRYIVGPAGVMLARVTQVKNKGNLKFIGIDAGMHTLIRPAMYDAYHEIYNLSKINEEPKSRYQVVGPICESGDVVGHNRMLPETEPGDILLIDNAGAYGAVMSMHRYNMKPPAREIIL
tara:strand:- start:4072 stop:5214 length:1143 start_codon:yes stop_codon:yes gene_type:complete